MTALKPDRILALACEAGLTAPRGDCALIGGASLLPGLARFAAAVAAAEREACAALCQELGADMLRQGRLQARVVTDRVAFALRAGGRP